MTKGALGIENSPSLLSFPLQGVSEEEPREPESRGLRLGDISVLPQWRGWNDDWGESEDRGTRWLHWGGDLAGWHQRFQEEHEGWVGGCACRDLRGHRRRAQPADTRWGTRHCSFPEGGVGTGWGSGELCLDTALLEGPETEWASILGSWLRIICVCLHVVAPKGSSKIRKTKVLIFFWHVQGLAHQSPAAPSEPRAGVVFDTDEELRKESLRNSWDVLRKVALRNVDAFCKWVWAQEQVLQVAVCLFSWSLLSCGNTLDSGLAVVCPVQNSASCPHPTSCCDEKKLFLFSVNIKLSSARAPGKGASCGNLARHHSCTASVVPGLEHVPAVSQIQRHLLIKRRKSGWIRLHLRDSGGSWFELPSIAVGVGLSCRGREKMNWCWIFSQVLLIIVLERNPGDVVSWWLSQKHHYSSYTPFHHRTATKNSRAGGQCCLCRSKESPKLFLT